MVLEQQWALLPTGSLSHLIWLDRPWLLTLRVHLFFLLCTTPCEPLNQVTGLKRCWTMKSGLLLFLSVTWAISTWVCFCLTPGDCEAAICGGVNCIIDPRTFVSLSKAKMISPEGISKPFSKKADGYGRGEGCGVVFLKPLDKVRLLMKQPELSLVACLGFVSSALIMTFPEKFFQFMLKINEAFLKHLCTSPSIGKGSHI